MYVLQALPALALRLPLVSTIRENACVVVRGATGSGKSTQVTQYIAEMVKFKQLTGNKVLCTQPRKVAAEALAARVNEEWYAGNDKDWINARLGWDVGYRVGDRKMCSKVGCDIC